MGEDEGRCFGKISNKAVVKSRIEMEQMLEAKTKQINKQGKQDIGYNTPWRWKVSVWAKYPLKVHVYLKPQTVTLFGNSVFVDIIS